MQETVEIVGLPPTQRAMSLAPGAVVVTHPSERNRAALYQIRRRISIGASDDVDGITDEAWIGSTSVQRQRHDRGVGIFLKAAAQLERPDRPFITTGVRRGVPQRRPLHPLHQWPSVPSPFSTAPVRWRRRTAMGSRRS